MYKVFYKLLRFFGLKREYSFDVAPVSGHQAELLKKILGYKDTVSDDKGNKIPNPVTFTEYQVRRGMYITQQREKTAP